MCPGKAPSPFRQVQVEIFQGIRGATVAGKYFCGFISMLSKLLALAVVFCNFELQNSWVNSEGHCGVKALCGWLEH